MGTSHAHAGNSGHRPWRQGLSWLFGILVLATVVLVTAKFSELQRFAEIARNAQPAWLLAAVVLQALTYVCAAGVWQGTLWRADIRPPFWSIIPLGLAKLFTDQALPTGGVSGTLLAVTGLERRGVSKEIGMAAMLISLVSYYVAYLISVIAALVILYSRHSLDRVMIAGATVFVVIALSIPAAALGARRWFRHQARARPAATLNKWLNRVPGLSTLKSAISKAPSDRLRDPISFGIAIVLQIFVFILDAGTLWVILQAIGAKATPDIALAAFVMAELAATIGPMPLGLGSFEAVCVTVLHMQGLSVEAALTATLLFRGFTFWLPMAPGLLLARRELNQRPARH
jgi:uncharacterized protein (TIRG00374 family)